MRPSILFLFVLSLIVACQKEDEPFVYKPIVLEDLPLTWVKDSMPIDLLTQYSIAVFVNDKGDERRIKIKYSLDTISTQVGSFPYKSELLKINFSDSLVKNFWMQMYATANYDDVSNHSEFLVITLTSSDIEHDGLAHVLFIDDEFSLLNRFFPDLNIAGLSFHNVHSNFLYPLGNDYGEIYYTTDQGIVGFRGEHGEMWGLKGWE